MLAALITVILTSFSGVMAPGPMFAVTLAKSLKSPWAGIQMSAGHAVVEVPLILLLFAGLSRYLENPVLHLVLGIVGGLMIIGMGITLFRSRTAASRGEKDIPHNAFVSGIFLTGLNPFFIAWWLTIGTLLLMNFLEAVGTIGLPLFIMVHWLCDFLWLSLVSFSIFRTRRFWNPKIQQAVFIVLSSGLVYFGGGFVIQAIAQYY
jgi:threonine/homoserine/homoserine lactone efflux protein